MQHYFLRDTDGRWRDQHGCEALEGVDAMHGRYLRTAFDCEPSNFWWLHHTEIASGAKTIRSPSRLARQG